jgi:branched-chain amino acid transport system substrate-binding protein
MKFKYFLKLAKVSFFSCVILTNTSIAENSSPSSAKIGAILPLTGDFAYVGAGIRQGIELALSEQPSSQIKVIFEDDLSLNRVATVNAARRLIDVEKVSVILNSAVNTVTALNTVLGSSKTLGFVVWDSNKTILELGSYVIGFGYANELAGEDMAAFAKNKLNITTVAIFSGHDEWSELVSKAFVSKFKSLGGSVSINESLALTTTDFRSLILKAKNKNIGALYLPLYPGPVISAVKQARELDFKGAILTADGFSAAEREQLGPDANGIYFTQSWVNDPEFSKAYRKHFKIETDAINMGFVALGHDIVKCLMQIKDSLDQKSLQFTSENIKHILIGFECDGVMGKTKFQKNRLSTRGEPIIVVRNGQFQLAD